jgi:nucleoside-diphosphate-sugar epimerase
MKIYTLYTKKYNLKKFKILITGNNMNDKKIIVTGGLGFIGSNLVERLIAQNEVTIIDDNSTGKSDNVNHLTQDNRSIDEQINDIYSSRKSTNRTEKVF